MAQSQPCTSTYLAFPVQPKTATPTEKDGRTCHCVLARVRKCEVEHLYKPIKRADNSVTMGMREGEHGRRPSGWCEGTLYTGAAKVSFVEWTFFGGRGVGGEAPAAGGLGDGQSPSGVQGRSPGGGSRGPEPPQKIFAYFA